MFGLDSKLFVFVSILIINVFVVLRTKETVFLRCKEIWYDFKVEACVINSPTHWKKVLFNSLIFIICCLFGNFKWQFYNFGSLTWIHIRYHPNYQIFLIIYYFVLDYWCCYCIPISKPDATTTTCIVFMKIYSK